MLISVFTPLYHDSGRGAFPPSFNNTAFSHWKFFFFFPWISFAWFSRFSFPLECDSLSASHCFRHIFDHLILAMWRLKHAALLRNLVKGPIDMMNALHGGKNRGLFKEKVRAEGSAAIQQIQQILQTSEAACRCLSPSLLLSSSGRFSSELI